MTKPHRRTAALRTAALFLVGVIVAPAISECAGWSASAAGRHICCMNRGGLASETSMSDCCGMSEQSNEGAPPETQLTRTPLKLFGPHFVPVTFSSFATRTFVPSDSPASRRAPVVPLYLQQASLLI